MSSRIYTPIRIVRILLIWRSLRSRIRGLFGTPVTMDGFDVPVGTADSDRDTPVSVGPDPIAISLNDTSYAVEIPDSIAATPSGGVKKT